MDRSRRLSLPAAARRAALAALLLAGCQPVAEQERELALAQRASCLESGFEEGSDAFRLCLVLQGTNERIARLERRIEFLDSEVSRIGSWGGWRRWP